MGTAAILITALGAFAAPPPSGKVTPDSTPCQVTVWKYAKPSPYYESFSHSHTYSYTTHDYVEETYDTAFQEWCGSYRNYVTLTTNNANANGTLHAGIAACGGGYTQSSMSFSGSTSYSLYSPVISPYSGQGQGEDVINAEGQNWTDTTSCYP